MIMPKTAPDVSAMKKADVIKCFNDLWTSARKLSDSLEGHHTNAEGLLSRNEMIRKENKRLDNKIDWLEDRIVHLSANQAKQHNRVNYGVRQRRIKRRTTRIQTLRIVNTAFKLLIIASIGVVLYQYILPLHWSIMIGQIIAVLILIFAGLIVFERSIVFIRKLFTGNFWRR